MMGVYLVWFTRLDAFPKKNHSSLQLAKAGRGNWQRRWGGGILAEEGTEWGNRAFSLLETPDRHLDCR